MPPLRVKITESVAKNTRREEESSEPAQLFDTERYDSQIGLDRGEAFHYVYSGDHIDYHKELLSAMNEKPVHKARFKREALKLRETIRVIKSRRKRALFNFVGEALHVIAGTPGPTEYQMLAKQTEKQKNRYHEGELSHSVYAGRNENTFACSQTVNLQPAASQQ